MGNSHNLSKFDLRLAAITLKTTPKVHDFFSYKGSAPSQTRLQLLHPNLALPATWELLLPLH